MILSNWRIRLMHITLTGMEVAWLLPVLLAGVPTAAKPIAGFVSLFVLALLWLLIYDVLDFFEWNPRIRQLSLFAGYLLVTALWLWTDVYRPMPFFPLTWLRQAPGEIVNFENGITPQAVVFSLSTWLWLRAAWSARRNLTSLAIERGLRVGMLLLLAGAALVQAANGEILPFWLPALYLGFGISALSLARSDERHAMAHVRGGAPPAQRIAQFSLVALGITLIAGVIARWLPGPLTRGLNWLGIVVELLIILVQLAFVAAFILGAQVSNWLRGFLNWGTTDTNQVTMPTQGTILEVLSEQLEQPGRDITLPLWALDVLKYVPLVILGGIITLVFFLINRAVYRRRLRADAEDESEAGFSAGNMLRNGLNQLRNLADMSKKFRFGEGLLAAISVEAIYANVCRLAAQLGEPRPVAMPAETYLPVLRGLFSDLDEELERITRAYMRVHYGDQQVRAQELIALQRDYGRLRRAAAKAK